MGERVNLAKSGCHPRKAGELEGLIFVRVVEAEKQRFDGVEDNFEVSSTEEH